MTGWWIASVAAALAIGGIFGAWWARSSAQADALLDNSDDDSGRVDALDRAVGVYRRRP